MMRHHRAGRSHLDLRSALDYLESRMKAGERRAVEDHLGSPCAACRERLRELGQFVERMLLDRVPAVPRILHERALQVFEPVPARARRERLRASIASLLFDSWLQPLPAATRRAVGETRRLRYALGLNVLELELEAESPESRTLRGRLDALDPSLHTIEVALGGERLSVRPDAGGAFVLDRVPAGKPRITVTGPGQRYRIPPLK